MACRFVKWQVYSFCACCWVCNIYETVIIEHFMVHRFAKKYHINYICKMLGYRDAHLLASRPKIIGKLVRK